ncbi:replication factor A protein 3 [Saccharata proteae CBS 121410]|uniref:Replication factor A protein 3 n=1 Tax=Saccharata proteae CBS 121410 TaxID=1314787 RepID=A0A9P4LUX3_9PEZI|nr:replication factor A protein 3 [Saccharata proteae CBS 121410]
MSESTPRITAQYLQQFQNQTVRILGKVTQLRGDQATIDAGGSINVHLNREAHLTMNNAAEIIGKVNNDLSVKVLTSTDFGSNIDFNAAMAVVEATHRHKEIFYNIEDE